jgi:hypothetical protein
MARTAFMNRCKPVEEGVGMGQLAGTLHQLDERRSTGSTGSTGSGGSGGSGGHEGRPETETVYSYTPLLFFSCGSVSALHGWRPSTGTIFGPGRSSIQGWRREWYGGCRLRQVGMHNTSLLVDGWRVEESSDASLRLHDITRV